MQSKISFEQAAEWADGVMDKMTLKEKCDYVGGTDVFYTKSIERLNISKVMFADATAGVVLRDRFFDVTYQNALDTSVAFPAPILLAATWNPALVESYAVSIGEECSANGIGVLLAPGFNLYRLSQCGRNFEYFGEDPYLISRMIEKYVEGVQSTGTIATLKHFVANNTDYFRRKSNSIVDERTLHEIYLPAFKAGIDAGAMAVMTSYNLVNGEWTGQCKDIIKKLLRETLGFKWLVMTDWWSVYDSEKIAQSGQDLEMPASQATLDFEEKIIAEDIYEKDIDRMVKSILTTFKAMDLFNRKPHPELSSKLAEHEQVSLQTAREGTVLLRNTDSALPILNKAEPILLLGDYIHKHAMGIGAAFVKGFNQTSQFDALGQEFESVHYDSSPTDDVIKQAKRIILSIGTQDAESWDRPFELSIGEELYIRRVLNLNSNVIVLVNSGSGIRMTDWYQKAAAIVYCFYNGQNGNTAVAEILAGKTNPSGKLPFTIEREFSDAPGADYIPEGEALYYGENDAWEAARDVYDVEYKEGVFVGYRWYEHKNIEPLYVFGFGLSYTRFEYSNIRLSHSSASVGDEVEVSFDLTNIGEQTGLEVTQLYVQDVECSEARPIKELKGFEKVLLQPGETQTITLKLKEQDFSFWSEETGGWLCEVGVFKIHVGSSSACMHLEAELTLG